MQRKPRVDSILSALNIKEKKVEAKELSAVGKLSKWANTRGTDLDWCSLTSVVNIQKNLTTNEQEAIAKKIIPNGIVKLVIHPHFLDLERHVESTKKEYANYKEELSAALKKWETNGTPVFIFVEHTKLKEAMDRLGKLQNGDVNLKPNEWLIPTRDSSPDPNRWILGADFRDLVELLLKHAVEIEVAGELTGYPSNFEGCVTGVMNMLKKALPDAKIYNNKGCVYPQKEVKPDPDYE